MANYLGWEITNKGRELLARAMNNETKINITKFKIGAGYNTGNDRELTDLLDKRNEFPINSYERKGNGNVEFTFIVSNKTGSGASAIINSYKISEMGIYARDDFGTEILYAYNKGTDGDYIPVFNGKNAIDIMEKCIIVIDQSANLNVTIDSSNTYITRDSVERNYVKKTDLAEENKAGIITLSAVKGLIPNATEYKNGTVNLRQINNAIDTKVPNATSDTAGKVMLGTTANTALEGKRLAEIIGIEFGGNIQAPGTKTVGKFYYDTVTKFYYECIVNNSLTYNDTTKFRAISNKPISDRLEDALKIKSYSFPFAMTQAIVVKQGKICTITVDSGSAFVGKYPGEILLNIPEGFRPAYLVAAPASPNGSIQIFPDGNIVNRFVERISGTIYFNATYITE